MGMQQVLETQVVTDLQLVPVEENAMVLRLKGFREYLSERMAPEPWEMLQASMVVLLADICDVLGLTEPEKDQVLGSSGYATLTEIYESRVEIVPLNERQVKVLNYVHKYDRIKNGDFQQLCPWVSTETLRLDLVDLVTRGLLEKHGRCRGTFYSKVD